MGKPYSENLRVRVVRGGHHGGTIPEIAEQFGVSISYVARFHSLHRETGSVSSAKIGGYKGYALAAHEDGRQATMAFIHRLGQSIGDAGPNPDHCGLLDAESHGDGVRRLEADAADIARQPIRVLRHHLDSIGAIGLEDAHRPRRADAMAVKEDHDFAYDLLLFGPGDSDTAGPHWTDAIDLAQAGGLGLHKHRN